MLTKIKTDRISSLFGCKLSDWVAELNVDKNSIKDKIKVYNEFAVEGLLVCFKQ